MATQIQDQYYQHHSSQLCDGDSSNLVRRLNNRASGLVSIGNFSNARILFEVALANHMQIARNKLGQENPSSKIGNLASSESDDYVMEDSDDDSSCKGNISSGDTQYFPTRDEDSNIANEDSRSHVSTVSFQNSDRRAYPQMQLRRRISSCRQLKTPSYCGQDIGRLTNHWMYHKIYSMPIQMNSMDWERAITEMRTFVLIFNAALCHHLQGMELLSQHQVTPARAQTPLCIGLFATAKNLYELALKAFIDAQSKVKSGLAIDRLWYPSIFNNLSHVCKILQGGSSNEACHYDSLLLKAVYWLIDGRSSNNDPTASQNSQSPVSLTNDSFTNSDITAIERRANDSGNNSAHLNDDVAEIIDAFLENVFYLIGAAESVVPAAAA